MKLYPFSIIVIFNLIYINLCSLSLHLILLLQLRISIWFVFFCLFVILHIMLYVSGHCNQLINVIRRFYVSYIRIIFVSSNKND